MNVGYKVLACDRITEPAVIAGEPANFQGALWMLGFELPLPTGPIVFMLDPARGRNLAPMYKVGALLMRQDLLQTIQSVGVNNLQVAPAIIEDPRTSERRDDYKLVNVIGKVSAVDEGKSTRLDTPPGRMIDGVFEKLELDESRLRGLLMCRLAEAVRHVLVHDVVVAAIEAGDFDGMSFYSPADCI